MFYLVCLYKYSGSIYVCIVFHWILQPSALCFILSGHVPLVISAEIDILSQSPGPISRTELKLLFWPFSISWPNTLWSTSHLLSYPERIQTVLASYLVWTVDEGSWTYLDIAYLCSGSPVGSLVEISYAHHWPLSVEVLGQAYNSNMGHDSCLLADGFLRPPGGHWSWFSCSEKCRQGYH